MSSLDHRLLGNVDRVAARFDAEWASFERDLTARLEATTKTRRACAEEARARDSEARGFLPFD